MDKVGATGFGILTLYRILLVSVVALVVFFLSGLFYTYYIDVRTGEAKLISRGLADCLFGDGLFVIGSVDGENLPEFCGLKGELNRVYVRARFYNFSDVSRRVSFPGEYLDATHLTKPIYSIEWGDSGVLWVRDFLSHAGRGAQKKYVPGLSVEGYRVVLKKNRDFLEGYVLMEVAVGDEE